MGPGAIGTGSGVMEMGPEVIDIGPGAIGGSPGAIGARFFRDGDGLGCDWDRLPGTRALVIRPAGQSTAGSGDSAVTWFARARLFRFWAAM